MSYQATYGLLVKDGIYVIANLEYSVTDATATPANISVIRRDLIDKQYELLAASLSKTPQEVTEAELLASFGLTDQRT